MNNRIIVTNLTKRYGTVIAVNGLSFTVEPGRVTGFLGPNAAGKTTTLRMILGLVRPDAGEATIGGVRYRDLPKPATTVGAVLEVSGAHPGRSGRNHLRAITVAADLPERRVDEVLELVGMSAVARQAFRTYSLGMRQRLAIAAAMLGDPSALVLDEPANGLDPSGIHWMRTLLRHLADAGRTVLVSSHLLSEVQQLADDVIIISGGRLVTRGPVTEVVASIAVPQVRVRTPDSARLSQALDNSGQAIQTARLGPDLLSVSGITASDLGRIASDTGVVLHELVEQRPDLEQAFLSLTQQALTGAAPPVAGVPRIPTIRKPVPDPAPTAGQPTGSKEGR